MPLRHPKSWDNDWGALGSEDSRWESQSTGSPDFDMASESFASQKRKATPRTLPQDQSPLPKCLEPLSPKVMPNREGNKERKAVLSAHRLKPRVH